MAGQITGKQAAGNMEYLLKLLHKEWERSGKTKVEISLEAADVKAVGAGLAQEIQKRQGQLETAEMTFRQSMALSKENFILLRLGRKIKKAESKANQKETSTIVKVELDKEEYKLLSTLIKVEEV